jgi:hypothetical protein
MPRAPGHHVTIPPSHKRPRLRLGGWCGQACPLIPTGRRDVIVGDLHRCRLGAAGESGPLLLHHDHLLLHHRGRGLLPRHRNRRLQLRLSGRGRRTRLHGRHRRLRHCDWRRQLYLCHRPRLGHGGLLSNLRRHLPRLRNCRRRPRPRGRGRVLRVPARRRLRAYGRPRRPRRAPPSWDGRVRPQHLGWREGGHGWRHPANTRTKCQIPAYVAHGPSKGNS